MLQESGAKPAAGDGAADIRHSTPKNEIKGSIHTSSASPAENMIEPPPKRGRTRRSESQLAKPDKTAEDDNANGRQRGRGRKKDVSKDPEDQDPGSEPQAELESEPEFSPDADDNVDTTGRKRARGASKGSRRATQQEKSGKGKGKCRAEAARPATRAPQAEEERDDIEADEDEQPDDDAKSAKGRSTKARQRAPKLEDAEAAFESFSKSTRASSSKIVGAHMSIAGGHQHAVWEAVIAGARGFALFLQSSRQWKAPPLAPETVAAFKEACKRFGFEPKHILPHGSYLLNLASGNPELLNKSRDTLLNELRKCHHLGLSLYNFHPGSWNSCASPEEGLQRVAESINLAHKEVPDVTLVLENTAGGGKTLGRRFEELSAIIESVLDKDRVGVCLDTCHLFAAGYDIRTPEGLNQTLSEFDSLVGLGYLKGMHVNDCKSDLASRLDRHENIGLGKIGLDCFRALMRDPRLDGVPLILELPPPCDQQISLLYSLENTDAPLLDTHHVHASGAPPDRVADPPNKDRSSTAAEGPDKSTAPTRGKRRRAPAGAGAGVEAADAEPAAVAGDRPHVDVAAEAAQVPSTNVKGRLRDRQSNKAKLGDGASVQFDSQCLDPGLDDDEDVEEDVEAEDEEPDEEYEAPVLGRKKAPSPHGRSAGARRGAQRKGDARGGRGAGPAAKGSRQRSTKVREEAEKSDKGKEMTENVFRMFDVKNTGFITAKDVARVAQSLGEVLTKDEVQEMIDLFDEHEAGKLSLPNFAQVVKKTGLLDFR